MYAKVLGTTTFGLNGHVIGVELDINKAITASGGTFSWSIPKTTHGIDSNAIIVQLYEVATGAQVMADVTVDQTNYNVTITIVGTGTLATGTYRAVLFG